MELLASASGKRDRDSDAWLRRTWNNAGWTRGRTVVVFAALAGTVLYCSGIAKGELRQEYLGPVVGLLLDNVGTLSFAAAVAFLIPRIDAAQHRSCLLVFFGSYSFEIYLVHFPFMEYYDFDLFRKPLVLFFFMYLGFVTALAVGLKSLTVRFNALTFTRSGSAAHG